MAKGKYIAGIHNYCDRWCEKCAFTNRCNVFAAEQEHPLELPDDPGSPEFWDQLKNNFQETLEMLQHIMEQLDEKAELLGADEKEGTADEHDPADPDEANKHPMLPTDLSESTVWQEQYSDAVHVFFKNNEDFFSDQEEKFDSQIQMGLPIDVEQLGFLHEALQTIRWFQHLIGAKIHRAMSQFDFSYDTSHLQSDGNGSAKVAMIGIQRSNDAWRFLVQFFPAKSEEVQQVLHALQNTRAELEKRFPNWRQFHRPGFDDEPDAVVRLDYNPN